LSILDHSEIELLRAADSPTVANVLELFDIRSYVSGYTNQALTAVYPELPPAVGYAVTATFRAGYPSARGDAYSDMPALIEAAQDMQAPRMVVFQDLDDPSRAATYGELMATAFKTFGFAGLITTGAARDIEQVRRLRFPCWASSTIVSHGYSRIVDINTVIVAGGLQVKPGDLLHADANGIINIPNEIAGAVAKLCMPYMDAEQTVLDYLNGPNPTPSAYKDAVARMKTAMAELRIQAKSMLSA
jgi:4-hydroxy-4-methyl-2-oxoglutarate aldolase